MKKMYKYEFISSMPSLLSMLRLPGVVYVFIISFKRANSVSEYRQ